MTGARHVISAALVAVALIPVSSLQGAVPVRFAGELSGLVMDAAGKPQAGALVLLFNRQDRMLQRVATDFSGSFSFDDLIPDLYSVQVSFATFVPAMKNRVQVKPGMRSLLEINLSKVFSSIQLVNTIPAPGGLMNDSWKWTLRSDSSLRPIMRLLPSLNSPNSRSGTSPATETQRAAMFSSSRGLVKISASDGMHTIAETGEADLGTQFAFATSVYGENHVKVSGNVGYGATSGTPAAAIRTTYSRDILGASPAVSVTMRQMAIASRSGGSDSSMPMLRTVSVSLGDKTQINDTLTAEYGFALDMVSFMDRLHYFSPYAKLTQQVPHGAVDLTFTSGNARPELGAGPAASEPNSDLRRDLTSLSVMPRISLDNGRARVQRGEDYELGVTQRYGSREYRFAAYRESISNTSLTIANADTSLFQGDLLPDLFSRSALFNAGRFDTFGYLATVTQDLGGDYKVSVSFGSNGVMLPGAGPLRTADDLRRIMQAGNRPAVTLRASGTVKPVGTRFVASYQWTDYSAALPLPQFETQSTRTGPGLNIMLRQPIPTPPGMPWRIEATAEFRNMLAQGYLPLSMVDGRQLLLVNTPRSVRGGFAFVF
ncbi:MAG TPA: carboxypeptidase-like regulatory domain-containing protein [Bryobacteraceae bacterium]|nr:carboxypeptidase-like regulatory domain-containing protein [Bryobacteraceae bacterium]